MNEESEKLKTECFGSNGLELGRRASSNECERTRASANACQRVGESASDCDSVRFIVSRTVSEISRCVDHIFAYDNGVPLFNALFLGPTQRISPCAIY